MQGTCLPTLRGEIKKARVNNYDFSSGIFEFIDNAIDIGTTRIRIDLRARSGSGSLHKILISDNMKSGIPRDLLKSIFSWTFERQRKSTDIGEYGTGFKTAAVNIADKLTILTKDGELGNCHQAIAVGKTCQMKIPLNPKLWISHMNIIRIIILFQMVPHLY